jgi:hypothetical protein
MSDDNIVSDNTDDLSSLFDGSVTADLSVATMPTGTRGTTEPTSGVDDAVDNQQDWYDFDGDINDLLSSRPPTYLRQSKLRKSSRNGIATKYEYRFCRCGCAYKLSVRITCDASSGVEQIHYKEVTVRYNSYVTCFVTVFDTSLMLLCVMSLFLSRFQTIMLILKPTVIAAV